MLVCMRSYTPAFGNCIAQAASTPRKARLESKSMALHPINSFNLPYVSTYILQEPLPGPRQPVEVDWTSGDAELFMQHFCPMGKAHIECLGDLWHDVTCMHYICDIR